MSLGRNLKRLIEQHGYVATRNNFADAIREGRINPRTVSIRGLAEGLLGSQWKLKIQNRNGRVFETGLLEAGSTEAVDASAFADITGQLLVNEIKAKYETADFVGDQLVETVPITNGNIGPQRTPWLSNVVDDASTIQPGMPYPKTSFTEQYIDYPAPEKFGEICQVTMEAIYSDLTGQILDSAGDVGRRVRINKEERILNVVAGITNNHKWNGTSYNTYQTATPWINVKNGQVITDWTHLNEMEQLLVQMTDPVTGKPILVKAEWLLTVPYKYYTLKRVQHATDVRTGDGASTTMATYAPSPLETNYTLLKSPFLYQRLTAATTATPLPGGGVSAANAKEYVFLGSKQAFVWRQAEPMTTVEAPAQAPANFYQDIALAVKAREWGVAAVRDPRYVVKSYNA